MQLAKLENPFQSYLLHKFIDILPNSGMIVREEINFLSVSPALSVNDPIQKKNHRTKVATVYSVTDKSCSIEFAFVSMESRTLVFHKFEHLENGVKYLVRAVDHSCPNIDEELMMIYGMECL